MSAEAILDPRFAALPRLLRDATNPDTRIDQVRRFVEELLRADDDLFAVALHFISREGRGFVFVRAAGREPQDARTWTRWPLRRLFANRRGCVITNPATQQRALALPFNVGAERHVVVAPLRDVPLDAARETLLSVLESVATSAQPHAPLTERIPRFVSFGETGEMTRHIANIAGERGWPLTMAPTFGHVMLMLEEDSADVALIEEHGFAQPDGLLRGLRAIRHAAKIADVPVILVTAGDPPNEIRTLVDFCISPEAADADILRALKAGIALVSRTRSNALRATVERMKSRLRSCADLDRLAQTCAQGAALIGFDLSCVMLADEDGIAHTACFPPSGVLGEQWPTPFVTGERIAHTHAERRFFQEAFDDPDYAERLADLHPVSAAAMPIGERTQIAGTVVALTTQRGAFEPEFEALAELCSQAADVGALLRTAARGENADRRIVTGPSFVDLYRGRRARSSFNTAGEGAVAAIVALEHDEEGQSAKYARRLLSRPGTDLKAEFERWKPEGAALLAIVRADQSIAYACSGFPVPLRVRAAGPVSSVRRAEHCEFGTIALEPGCTVLLYSNEFARSVEIARLVAAVQHELRSGGSNVVRAVSALISGRKGVAFAAVTTPLNAVDVPRPLVLL